MSSKFTEADAAILRALGEDDSGDMETAQSPHEERIIAGFEEIQRFAERTGGLPQHREDRSIQERMLAVRLDNIRGLKEAHSLLDPLDHQKILGRTRSNGPSADELTDDQLIERLSTDELDGDEDILELRHVRSSEEREAAEDIANRKPCKDFASFRKRFETVRKELASGARKSMRFEKVADIKKGRYFILGGQMAYVDEVGDTIYSNKHRRNDARLRVIFDNGTENNMLLRSLQRGLLKDEAGRRISEPNAGAFLGNWKEENEVPKAIVYVLRSNSKEPYVVDHRSVLHKIGVTTTDIKKRLSSAHLQPTYLMASVEWVTSFELFGIDHKKIEKMIHKVFSLARAPLVIPDRFGNPVRPREWFIVPDYIIAEVVDRIRNKSIMNCIYDPKSVSLVKLENDSSED